jgi:transposase
MKPYSNDLRRRIVEAYDSGEHSLAEVADLFSVSLASVKNFVRRNRETGSADALPHAGGKKPSLNEKARSFVGELVKQNNDLTLAQLCRRVKARHRQAVSVPTMGRLLQTLGLPRKKSRSTLRSVTRPGFSKRAASTGKKSAR